MLTITSDREHIYKERLDALVKACHAVCPAVVREDSHRAFVAAVAAATLPEPKQAPVTLDMIPEDVECACTYPNSSGLVLRMRRGNRACSVDWSTNALCEWGPAENMRVWWRRDNQPLPQQELRLRDIPPLEMVVLKGSSLERTLYWRTERGRAFFLGADGTTAEAYSALDCLVTARPGIRFVVKEE